MADNECGEESNLLKVRVEMSEISSRRNPNSSVTMAAASNCKNGLKLGCDCRLSSRPCLVVSCAVKLTKCVKTMSAKSSDVARYNRPTSTTAAASLVVGGGGAGGTGSGAVHQDAAEHNGHKEEASGRTLTASAMDVHDDDGGDRNRLSQRLVQGLSENNNNNNGNKRRSLRFHSSESSDSGVTALSNADYSPSSVTSDITDPGSPPSPACACLPSSSSVVEGGYNSPPSCHGSYDSGLEETMVSSSTDSPQTPVGSPEAADLPDLLQKDVQCSPCSIVAAIDDSSSLTTTTGSVCHDWLESQDSKASSCCEDEPAPAFFATPLDRKTVKPPVLDNTQHCKTAMASRIGPCQPHVFRHLSKLDRSRGSPIDPFLRCRWFDCGAVLPCGGDIVDHIRGAHVDPQVDAESFVCQWEGCKVFNRKSCSLSWLERHVLTHSGNKPFRCIVEGCGQRFASQTILERHVNSHFNQPHSAGQASLAKRKDDTPAKILKKRKLRYRRTAWMARKEDFFDSGIMECVRHQLLVNSEETPLDLENYGSDITFHSTVIGTQVEDTGKVRVLLHWIPENLIPDEWVHESQVQSRSKQTVPVSTLPLDSLRKLDPTSGQSVPRHNRKNRRK